MHPVRQTHVTFPVQLKIFRAHRDPEQIACGFTVLKTLHQGERLQPLIQQKRFLLQHGQRFTLHQRSGVAVFICQHVRHDFTVIIVAGMAGGSYQKS
ncbi:hypothetical protein AB2475_11295 [Salmonella enterica]|uniref:hypothetical protein n=1 Tax=Salmonella enterica TaxID=28901 RepID=UPI0034640FA1